VLHEVVRRASVRITDGREGRLAGRDSDEAGVEHQPRDALPADVDAVRGELRVEARRAVRAARLLAPDPVAQPLGELHAPILDRTRLS
jgi:hypothetical protein